MKKTFCAVALALMLFPAAFADEEASDETGWYSGAAAQLVLPQGGSRMHRLGGAAARVGYYFTGSLAFEAEAAWLENAVGLSARALWHLHGWDEFNMLFGYERFDPFLTLGARGWIHDTGRSVRPPALARSTTLPTPGRLGSTRTRRLVLTPTSRRCSRFPPAYSILFKPSLRLCASALKNMKNIREEWYDKDAKVAVTLVDVTDAAQALARGHLCGPTSAYFLSKALAAAALLGSEMSEDDETLILQMKCKGPLGGFNVECTAAGTLRGYTEKKILDDFDGMGVPDPRKAVGEKQLQVTRSVPGRILSQGISNSLDGYLAGSLQRKAVIFLEAAVSDDVEILEARGVMVEEMPDAKDTGVLSVDLLGKSRSGALAVASRNILGKLGLKNAELRKTTPLSFACRCSPDRAIAMLAALSPEERAALPPTIDITCHMCGRTFTVNTRQTS